jgi:MarR family transcriptional regulator, 2-MHQ and catechol-resistance regulon repressor
MAREAFLSTVRELVRCYQAFESFSARHIRQIGLTPAQFDIVATLGNTEGMSFKELGERTLITKGTLTGVVDRLVAQGLVRRAASATDGRSQIAKLTPEGDALFQRIFPEHMDYLRGALGSIDSSELAQTETALRRLRQFFKEAS